MIYDRVLVGELISEEVARQFGGRSNFVRAAENRPSKSTLDRAIKGDPRVEHETFKRIEHILGLPRDFLHAVATHDVDAIEASSISEDLRRWLLTRITAGETPTESRRRRTS